MESTTPSMSTYTFFIEKDFGSTLSNSNSNLRLKKVATIPHPGRSTMSFPVNEQVGEYLYVDAGLPPNLCSEVLCRISLKTWWISQLSTFLAHYYLSYKSHLSLSSTTSNLAYPRRPALRMMSSPVLEQKSLPHNRIFLHFMSRPSLRKLLKTRHKNSRLKPLLVCYSLVDFRLLALNAWVKR